MNIHSSIILADQTSSSLYGGGAYGAGSYSVGQSATTGTSSSPPTTATGTTGSGNEQQTNTVQLAPQPAAVAPQHASPVLWPWLVMFVSAAALVIFIRRWIVSRRGKRTAESYATIAQPNAPPPPADNDSSPRDPYFL